MVIHLMWILRQKNKKGIGVPYSSGLIKLYVKVLGVKIHAMDVFWKESNGEMIIGEQFESGTRHIIGSKIQAGAIPDAWKNAVGTYAVENYDDNDYRTIDTLELTINSDNVLELRGSALYPRKMGIQLGLSPLSDELAIIPGYNFEFFGGETVKLIKEMDGTSAMYFSGYKLKRIGK